MSRRSHHGKCSKLKEDKFGKLKMGKRRRNDGLAGIMASDKKPQQWPPVSSFTPHISYWNSTSTHEDLNGAKKSFNFTVEEDFPQSFFQMHGERSVLTNHYSWSEPRDFSRRHHSVDEQMKGHQVTWPATVYVPLYIICIVMWIGQLIVRVNNIKLLAWHGNIWTAQCRNVICWWSQNMSTYLL